MHAAGYFFAIVRGELAACDPCLVQTVQNGFGRGNTIVSFVPTEIESRDNNEPFAARYSRGRSVRSRCARFVLTSLANRPCDNGLKVIFAIPNL